MTWIATCYSSYLVYQHIMMCGNEFLGLAEHDLEGSDQTVHGLRSLIDATTLLTSATNSQPRVLL